MAEYKLRSHNYVSLTNYEIEKYLEHNDLIFIAVGNCETHAGYPVDCEGIAAEGWSRLLAEKTNALFLPNVMYFNPGGTQIGRGTIHMGMTEGFQYTKALAHSLLNQGFRRQVWMPSHYPTTQFLHPMVTEFFDETKVPMLFLDVMAYLKNMGLFYTFDFSGHTPPRANLTSDGEEVTMNDVMIAGYKICGRLEDIPCKGEVDFPPVEVPEGPFRFPVWFEEYNLLGRCNATFMAPAPFYYSKPEDHVGLPVCEYTRPELERRAEIGLQFMNEVLDKAQIPELMLALKHLQEFEAKIVHEHYDHLPKNKYSAASPF